MTFSVRSLLVAGLVALAVVAAYLVGRAGPAPASAETSDGTSTVTVTGVGHVAVVPDQLAFDLSVSVLRDDLDQALDDGNTAMQSVVDTLKAVRRGREGRADHRPVDEPGVHQQEGAAADAAWLPGQPDRLGHRRGALDKASDIVTAALNAGGSGVRLNGLRLQVGDPDGSLEPARTDAVDQARAKAEEYAADTGRELGEIVRISEVNDEPYYRDELAYQRPRTASESAAFPIQAGQQDLTANVVVVYELK